VPLGAGKISGVPFTQYAALSVELLYAKPATYTLLPETAIALASALVIPLGKDKGSSVPFIQYAAGPFSCGLLLVLKA
jgi:hypothetical protein